MDAGADITAWGFAALGVSSVPVTIVTETPWSKVLRLETTPAPAYLKQTPAPLFIEAAILKSLEAPCGFKKVPHLVAENQELNCFLMTACGTHTLRTTFENDGFSLSLMQKGLEVYKALQSATAPYIDHFLQLGVPDWRPENLATLYGQLLADESFLAAQGFSPDEVGALRNTLPVCEQISRMLTVSPLPACLSHSDLHDNNMLLDPVTGQISLIDVGETAIEHPFISLACCLSRLSWRYKISPGSATDLALRETCYGATPAPIIKAAETLAPLSFALGNWRLFEVASHTALNQIPRLQGRLRNCLLEVLKSFSHYQ